MIISTDKEIEWHAVAVYQARKNNKTKSQWIKVQMRLKHKVKTGIMAGLCLTLSLKTQKKSKKKKKKLRQLAI